MDYTLSQNSIHQNMEDYMMLCEYEAATRTRVSSTEENSRFYTPHEHELETFALAYSIVNSNGATPTNGDLGWSRLPTPTLPQTVDRWNTETAAGSNSHRSSGYGTGNLDLRISPQLSHNDVNTSSSATHSHDALSPSSFAGLEHKVTYQYQLSDREKYPSKEQKCRLRSPQYVSDSQSVFYMPFSEPIFPMFIESTRVPQHEATAADDSPAPISSPTFEEHSDLADEDLGELHDDVDQIEELEKLHEPPYSDLIYRAIVSSPNKHMRVQEIYSWFKENTNKCGNSDSTGWQNSIRHNLSMNAVSTWLPNSSLFRQSFADMLRALKHSNRAIQTIREYIPSGAFQTRRW